MKEIFDFLKSKSLTLTEIRSPNKQDWKGSPFNKPKAFSVSLLSIKILGFEKSLNEKEYRLIHAVNRKNEERTIWVEIDKTLFQKPKFIFKEDKIRKGKKGKYVITKFENCPACNFELNKQDNICPDCGLHFT
ncbi:hypothetical protein [Carboxylicivirga sp. N1Y90]|uniref:hypothetical protein n=1 Tax=Carboxylicivirga fragile TaxID=3417571 RepID=UPI003D356F48|nr:hypothetical protein [Marinilabiliaceae bacterium N1Y90]